MLGKISEAKVGVTKKDEEFKLALIIIIKAEEQEYREVILIEDEKRVLSLMGEAKVLLLDALEGTPVELSFEEEGRSWRVLTEVL